MASRSIVVKIITKGAKEASTSINKVGKGVDELGGKVKKTDAQLRTHELHLKRLAILNEKLTTAQKRTSHVQNGLTKSFLKGNLAARAITFGFNMLNKSMTFVIDEITSFDLSMAKIAGIAGITGVALKDLDTKIRAIAIHSPKTAAEVADATLSMAKLGLSGNDLEESLQGVIDVSVALDESVSSVGETMVQVKNVFGLSVDEMSNIGDKLFTTIASSAVSLDKFRTAFGFVGGAAVDAGVNLDELNAVMGALSNSGLRASTIGTSLRKIFTELGRSNSKASKAVDFHSIKGIGLVGVLKKLKEAMDNGETSFNLFGRTAQNAGNILVKQIGVIEDLQQASENMAKKAETSSDRIKNTIWGKKKGFGSALSEDIRSRADGWIAAFNGVSEAASEHLRRSSAIVKFQKENKDLFLQLSGEEFKKTGNPLSLVSPKVNGMDFDEWAEHQLEAMEKLAGGKAKLDKIMKSGGKVGEHFAFDITGATPTKSFKDVEEARLKAVEQANAREETLNKQKAERLKVTRQLELEVAIKAQEKAQEETDTLNKQVIAIKGSEKAMEARTKELRAQYDADVALLEKEKELALFLVESSVLFHGMGIVVNGLNSSFTILGNNITDVFTEAGFSFTKLKDEFGTMVKQILADLIAMLIKLAVFKILLASFGGTGAGFGFAGVSTIGGAILQGLGGSEQPNATGMNRRVSKPTNILVGESGPEDVIIKPRTKSGSMGNSNGGVTVNINGDVFGAEKFNEAVRMANDANNRNLV